ncbi:MAG: 3-oxoadipate enol-lactonase [Deltaproteobacteria bacterium]|nr:3-oxoadipate enol-lactonase [Deltaproteobacteria bacterium]
MPFAEVNQTTLHYRFDGPEQGPVVMLSNALASDLTMWGFQVPALVEAGYRVLRYDSRGHGHSAVPEGPYSIEMLTADAAGLMDALGLEKVHFCGLSKGGMIGQMLGSQYGDRLISLALCSTAAYMAPRKIWDERIETVQKSGMAVVVDATIDRWFTKGGQTRLASSLEKIRRVILNTPVKGFCACCAAIRDMDQRETIRTVFTPTLVMVGEQDSGTPVSAAEQIHNGIASSALTVIPDGAHFVHMEQSSIFNHALLSFIKVNIER